MMEFWLKDFPERIAVIDQASLAMVRARIRELGQHAGLDQKQIETMAIVGSELGSNQIRHAGGGDIVCRLISPGGRTGLEILAADRGAGLPLNIRSHLHEKLFPSPAEASSSLQQGMAAVLRLADAVDFDSRSDEGLLVRARKFKKPQERFGYEIALLGRHHPEEQSSGDAGFFLDTENGFLAALADGMGHGEAARKAAEKALALARECREADLASLIMQSDELLRQEERGCALFFCRYDETRETLSALGAGDISCQVFHLKRDPRVLTTMARFPGIPYASGDWNIKEESEQMAGGSVVIMCTDGLKTLPNLAAERALLREHPLLIASHLLEQFDRGTDDSTVLVARFAARLVPGSV